MGHYLLGLGFFALVMLLYRRSRAAVARTAHTLLLLLVALAAFGVSTDVLNAFVSRDALEAFFVFAEEGGEHLVMTTIVGYLFVLSGAAPAEKLGNGTRGDKTRGEGNSEPEQRYADAP